MDSNLAHIHLLLNHFPTIGFAIGFILLVIGTIVKNEEIKHASLVILFLIALIAIPTYLSGPAALDKICERVSGQVVCPPGLSLTLIQEHEDWALFAFSVMEVTGFIAWLGLWQMRRTPKLGTANLAAVLLLGAISFGLMAVAANKGGDIRHPEIQSEQAIQMAKDGTRVPIARAIGNFVIAKTWVWPTCESLHFVGLSLLFVAVLFVNLRVLGIGKSLAFSSVYQFLPLGLIGFGVNLVTGMMFFLASPQQYIHNVEFHRKIVFVLLCGVNVLYFMLFDKAWRVKAGEDAPISSKVAAAISIYLWIGVLYYGEMLPFLGNSF